MTYANKALLMDVTKQTEAHTQKKSQRRKKDKTDFADQTKNRDVKDKNVND